MTQLSLEDLQCINGEYSWNEFCNDAGYLVGSAVAYATNATDMVNRALMDHVISKTIDGAPKR
ncbi:hypothetical protein [Dyadobacter frigoris]|uniref:Uncharacterized protein n=1 Tax=Dyadobacter frigoris TaxID=2576211 RepID=A0A4U6D903_9BACT|nr:hypothetical protein [Dyadobacter frigoris]TKT93095.1 hypothetical protein FDK13_04365 [Dyadobacter frigoris]